MLQRFEIKGKDKYGLSDVPCTGIQVYLPFAQWLQRLENGNDDNPTTEKTVKLASDIGFKSYSGTLWCKLLKWTYTAYLGCQPKYHQTSINEGIRTNFFSQEAMNWKLSTLRNQQKSPKRKTNIILLH